MLNRIHFHVPCKPYSPIDACNRHAAALGSPRTALLTGSANFNGHRIDIRKCFNGYYVAGYIWNGSRTIARGTLADCIARALEYYDNGHVGAAIWIDLYADNDGRLDASADEIKLCQDHERLTDGAWTHDHLADWWTWRHEVAKKSVADYVRPDSNRHELIFDPALIEECANKADYEAALLDRFGRTTNGR